MSAQRPLQPDPHPTPRGILCPYCGAVSTSDPKRCEKCGGFFDPLSRQATQNAMGPWFIRNTAAPFGPGCSFETLKDLIQRGKVTRDTILRGPSTRQYWNFASRTPGIANLLGACHNCHVEVKPDDFSCAACGAVFTPETDRQHMGLAPVHLLPGQAAPEIIAAASVDQVRVRPVAPRRPAVKRPPAPEPIGAPEPSRAAHVFGLVVLALIVLGAAAAGIYFFVAPFLNSPGPVAPSATSPAVQPAPQSAPQTPPAAVQPESPAPSGPTEPAPGQPATDSTNSAAAPPSVLASLLAEPLDEPALLRTAENLRRAGPPDLAEAWSLLVRQRIEGQRLRALP